MAKFIPPATHAPLEFSQNSKTQTLSFALGSRLPSLRDLGTGIGRTLRCLDATGWCVPYNKRQSSTNQHDKGTVHESPHTSGLEGLEGIAALPHLRELHASHNAIRDVTPLCLHGHLEVICSMPTPLLPSSEIEETPVLKHTRTYTQVLDLEANPLRRLASLLLLGSLPRLRALTLRGTPLRDGIMRVAAAAEEPDRGEWRPASAASSSSSSSSSSSRPEGEPQFRALVGAMLPGLLLLDGRRLLAAPAASESSTEVRGPFQSVWKRFWFIRLTSLHTFGYIMAGPSDG